MENMLDHQNTNQFYLLSVIVGVDIVEDLRLRGAIRFRNQCVEDHLPGQGTIPEGKKTSTSFNFCVYKPVTLPLQEPSVTLSCVVLPAELVPRELDAAKSTVARSEHLDHLSIMFC